MPAAPAISSPAVASPEPADAPARPLVAIIANVQTPYRAHLHRRLVREIPEIRIASLFTHGQPDQPWQARPDPAINPVEFGPGEPVTEQGRPSRWLSDWRKGGRIIAWLHENAAAAVLVGGYNDLARLRVIRWCGRAGVPCYLYADSNIHGDRARGVRRLVKRALVGWVVRRCTGVMPCGSLGAAYFKRYGARPERIHYFPYEPDYAVFEGVQPEQVRRARSRYGLEPSRRYAVVCARLVRVKRVDLAIRAFTSVAAELPDLDLVIVGDGPLRRELEAMVPAGLRPRVIWTGFIGAPEELAAVFGACDVLVCPSDCEPWGVVINEAAASGLAIVATEVVGAAAELVRDGVNGALVRPGDEAALARGVKEALALSAGRLAAIRSVLAEWKARGDPVEAVRAVGASIGARSGAQARGVPS
jgi:glycosyltransferase involved in cell wall biosynthesis